VRKCARRNKETTTRYYLKKKNKLEGYKPNILDPETLVTMFQKDRPRTTSACQDGKWKQKER